MNERIRELAEQAGFGSAWFEESSPGYPALPKEGMLKEFAELIVRETVKEMSHQLYWHGVEQSNNPSFYKAIEKTLEHFGVE